MTMRKLFRFKYEPCEGTCYAWCDVLPEELNKLNPLQRKDIICLMVDAHKKLCDNPNYSFGIDMNDSNKIFIGHFLTPNGLQLFYSETFSDCVFKVTSKVLNTDIPQLTGECTYGDNGAEDLGSEILRACIDEEYRNSHHENCSCKKVA